MNKKILTYFLACMLMLPAFLNAQTKAVLTIEGDIAKTFSFTQRQLDSMNKMKVHAIDMKGEGHDFSGIAVHDLLKAAGVISKEHNRDNLTKYVLIRSADNYEVLYSLSELDSAFSGRSIILADMVDGKPLPAAKGPFRIVVPGEEKRQARWIWGVTTIIIKNAKD